VGTGVAGHGLEEVPRPPVLAERLVALLRLHPVRARYRSARAGASLLPQTV
jgi:hypothetical protein